MKNYVILLAGGVGSRMGANVPKQFLEVNGKPIIVYTIENFQRNEQIEKIVVVCIKDWIDYVK
jgi:2-C-methyl-D-erythritol 4-phosphate cytidylyltransferase